MNTNNDESEFEMRIRLNRERTERAVVDQALAAQEREIAKADREAEEAVLAKKAMKNLFTLLARLDPEQIENIIGPYTRRLILGDVEIAAARGHTLEESAP